MKDIGEQKSNKFDWHLEGRHDISRDWLLSTVTSDT